MAQTAPGFQDMLSVYVETYNSTQKILTLFLLMADFDLTGTSDPYEYVVDQMNQLYEQCTIELMEQYLGLAQIEAGENFPEFPTGTIIYVQEDYLLEECQPYGYIPASVIDYTQFEFLKYRKIRLIYRHKPDFPLPSTFSDKPSGQPHHGINPAYGYPGGLVMSWAYPNLSGANPLSFTSVWIAYAAFSPSAHYRILVLTDWLHLLTADPNDPDYWMNTDVMDCFRPSVPADGSPWWSVDYPYKWISKNINDDWVDSYTELTNRGFAPNPFQRPLRWLSRANYSYRHVRPGSDDHVQVEFRDHVIPSKIYKKPPVGDVGGGIIPVVTAVGVLSALLGCLGTSVVWLFSIFEVNGETFEVNGETFEVKA